MFLAVVGEDRARRWITMLVQAPQDHVAGAVLRTTPSAAAQFVRTISLDLSGRVAYRNVRCGV